MSQYKIPYNKPYSTGKEFEYIKEAIANGHLGGNGLFTQRCQKLLQKQYGFKKCLLTTSCTDALEMCALLLNIKEGDEVIMPSFTFVSTANAFILRGAKIILADCEATNPNIDADKIEPLITAKTKAIIVVHYAGVACNMNAVMQLAKKYNVFVVEDAAQAIDSNYITDSHAVPLGRIGHLAAFSFHESKNIQCGEGGMLVINDEQFVSRAEIIWEKGTNRAAFFRGEIDKYNWVDVGSSFLPSEINAAFLLAQLQHIEVIQKKRKAIWNKYFQLLKPLHKAGKIYLQQLPEYAEVNAHVFYLVCKNLSERNSLIKYLKEHGVQAMFHYPGLHASPLYKKLNTEKIVLPKADYFADGLVRLPLYAELQHTEVETICTLVESFYNVSM